MKHYSDQELLDSIQLFYDNNNRTPTVKELPFSKEVFRLRFGSYTQALQLLNLPVNRRVGDMLTSPCEHCNTLFKSYHKLQRYCSHSCSAAVSNTTRIRPSTRATTPCVVCGTLHVNAKFCSAGCKTQYATDRFHQGLINDRKTLKGQMDCSKCSECGLSEWRGKRLSLELDHIDGDAGNNLPENLRIICPNCHSITDTWKNKNKGKGRKSRGLAL